MTKAKTPIVTPREWEIEVSILGRRTMVLGLVKMFGIAGLIMWALLVFLFAVQGEWKQIWPITQLVAMVMGGITVLTLIATVLVLGNRMRMRYRLDDDGITADVLDRRVKAAQTLAIIGGVLAGKPGAVGSGLISRSRNTEHTVWSAVARVDLHEGDHAVGLRNEWRTMMLVYCRPEEWRGVADEIAAAVARDRARRPVDTRGNPAPMLLLLTVVTIVATIPFFVLPHEVGGDVFAALLVLAFAVTSIWLLPIFAWVTWAGLAWIIGLGVYKGLLPYHSQFGGGVYPHWQLMSDDDWAILVAAGLGLLWHLWLGRRLLTGRIESALAGDEARMAGSDDEAEKET